MKTRYQIIITLASCLLALLICGGLSWLVFHLRFVLPVHTLVETFWHAVKTPLELHLGSRVLQISTPAAFYFISFLPLLWLPSVFSRNPLTSGKRILQAGLRSILWLLLVSALSEPVFQKKEHTLGVVALIDVSDSMDEKQIQDALVSIKELEKIAQSRGESFHALAFAEKTWILPSPLPPSLSIADIKKNINSTNDNHNNNKDNNHGIGQIKDVTNISATNDVKTNVGSTSNTHLQQALQQAYGLFPPRTLKKIIVFSDGQQTQGNSWLESAFAKEQNIQIDFYQPAGISTERAEIVASSLQLASADKTAPPQAGAPFLLQGEIKTNTPQSVKVVLRQNGKPNQEQAEQTILLQKGINSVVFRSQVNEPGEVFYQMEVLPLKPTSPLQDHFVQNNQAERLLLIQSRPRILYIEGDARSQNLLASALKKEQIQVDVKPPFAIPTTVSQLKGYDLVVLSDVPVHQLSHAQIVALQQFVKDQGGGLFFAAGENVFAPGAGTYSELESMLPVHFQQTKKKEQPSVAVVLCIDRSGSMNGPKLELAKEAAKATLEVLAPNDLIGVVAFDSKATPLIRLQQVKNRVRISSDIERLVSGGGTNLLEPLKEAYEMLNTVPANIKHVILLTDGQAEYTGIIDLADQMVAQKITVSTVGVGSGADQSFLQSISDHGNGRFYFSKDAASVPQIFTKEVKEVANASFAEEPVLAIVKKQVEFLKGISIASAPKLYGYVPALTKPRSETILAVATGDPLLVRWQFGLGKVVAFTSDIKNRWAVDWTRWPSFTTLFSQIVRSAMRRPFAQNRFEVQTELFPPFVSTKISAFDDQGLFISGLQSELEVVTPEPGWLPGLPLDSRRIVKKITLQQTAPGLYEAQYKLDKPGAYLLHAVHKTGLPSSPAFENNETLSLPTSLEYDLPSAEQNLLPYLAQKTQGQAINKMEQVFASKDRFILTFQPLWMYFVFVALLFYLLDIALRRMLAFSRK